MTFWAVFESCCFFQTKVLKTDTADSELFGKEVRRSAGFALKVKTYFLVFFKLKEASGSSAHRKDCKKLANHVLFFHIFGNSSSRIGHLIEDYAVSNNINHDVLSLVFQSNIPIDLFTSQNTNTEIALLPLLKNKSQSISE